MIQKYFTYCLLLFLLHSFDTAAQSFEVLKSEFYVRGKIGQRLETPIEVKNLTNNNISLVIERVKNNVSNGQSTFICWQKDCAENTSLHKVLEAGGRDNSIMATMETGISGGLSSVKYLIYNKNNPQDAVYITMNYTIEEPFGDTEIYTSDKIRITDIYPNPVSDFLYINYNLLDLNSNAKVGIHNVLGSVISEFQLEPMETKAKINTAELNPGVYFYSLAVNNETVLIKKFLVRK